MLRRLGWAFISAIVVMIGAAMPIDRAAAQVTMTKTASPTTYTTVGQLITYTYTFTNGNDFDMFLNDLTDDKVAAGNINCSDNRIPGFGSLSCTGEYAITAADITNGSVVNTGTAQIDTCGDGCISQRTATATITLAAQPSWTLTKTPSPTIYTGAGESITYSYLLTNTGNISISAISLTDDKVSPVNCPANTLAAGASMTCTGTYLTTATDVSNANVTNVATATGTPAAGTLAPVTAQATIFLRTHPDWTLTKTANPSTYSAAGQTITYSYVLTNTGNLGISAITVTDNRVSPVNCPSATLAVGASMTCTGTYIITATDLVAGSVTNVATANGTPTGGTLPTVTAQATIRAVVAAGSITIIKTAAGGNNTFNFTSTAPGVGGFTLTTVAGSATRQFAGLAAGTYTFSEVNLPLHWKLASITCAGDAGGTPTTTNVGAGSVSIGLDPGEQITCTFANTFDAALHIQQTQAVIQRFLSRRINLLANDEPDRPRFLRRIPGSLWGDPDSNDGSAPPSQPFSFSGQSGLSSTTMTFAASLSQAQAYAEAVTSQLVGKAPRKVTPNRFDVWMEAHFNEYNGDIRGPNNRGHFNIVYVGADYLVTRSVLVGVLAQFDWTAEASATLNNSISGGGVMAGPYLSARITPNLFFDTRFAAGVSNNKVNPFGLYEDKFATDRWLAHAKLTGNWWWGSFRVTPSAGVTFVQEHQLSYTDSLGIVIPDQTVTLGRFAAGPEIAYRILGSDGVIYEPHLQLRGTWDFIKPGATTVGNFIVSDDTFRAQIQGGLMARWPTGYALRVVGQYDGIGSSSFRNYGGQFWLNMPIQMAKQ